MKAAFFIFVTVLALAACKPETSPSDFAYKGKPIDAMCFYQLDFSGNETDSVDLASCTRHKDSDYRVVGDINEDGFIGYELQCADDVCTGSQIRYKYIGELNGQHLVQDTFNGGGSGSFSHLGFYEIEDGKLVIKKSFGSGDRCNGGLDDASLMEGKVHSSYNITPFDLVDISGGNTAKFEAYDDIQACAACCIGTADFVDDEMTTITMTQNPAEIVSEDLGPLDACFFGTYNEMYKEKNALLDAAGIKEFGEKFSRRCSQLKGKDLPPTIRSEVKSNSADQPIPENQ